ncbi:fatty acid synthase [Lingula anatina]|uniref:Fatty acid synthase n=1 Tax=Lingula anatina TaxID=7574 RepID=A0A1S3IF35_LINAN|nr:fatty acid synthase [Lingula anatina]|eukprot:XP_013396069.1 fatty acid synthase [Lingula anatina]
METRDDIVISGLSCRLPESENVQEFREHLLNGDDMVTEDDRRWEPGLHGLPRRNGKLKELRKFDSTFFGLNPKQANVMDPQLRILLEVTYEALVDAGINISQAKGSRIGVFVGSAGSDAMEAWSSDPETLIGYSMTGCQPAMLANRLTFYFDFNGPSMVIDTACSSSIVAMNQAIMAIQSGQCESAIVAGSHICLKPCTSLQFQKLEMLSPEGACKSFDASGNGYCRSEGIVAVYLQKAPAAKRIYCKILNSKTNADGRKEKGITFPSGEMQKALLTETYAEAKLSPSEVSYVECHGTGTRAGDRQEVNAVTEVFCQERSEPLLIGSVKSNMGHSEATSGLAALAKIIIFMKDGVIPPNLHYSVPNPDIPGLSDGRLKVVTECTKWNGGLVGLSSFGFGGTNAHLILMSNDQKEEAESFSAGIEPKLFTFCGRTEEGVQHVLKEVKKNPKDLNLQALLYENAFDDPKMQPYRGYTLLSTNELQEIQICHIEPRPVWYVFPGMGTQWHGMGEALMQIEVFKQSIMRSHGYLQYVGFNLIDLLLNGTEETLKSTVNSFVGIAAIQVALVDTLKLLGIKPDGIVGHSVGELACGYADDSMTAEETVLAAYWRGTCIMEANLEEGAMAAVGLNWTESQERCPEGVVPACHNALDSVTISGPKTAVTKFVQELHDQGVFAREVQTSGVAFHSYFMSKVSPKLKEAMEKVFTPKPRSPRWISSSIPETKWNTSLAQMSSADYYVNNLVSPVLFQEALQHVPKNAIIVEVAPHCLLQSILKRSLDSQCTLLSLMKRGHPNNLEYFWTNIGKLYMNGANPHPLNIYPPVHFPVPSGTPMISHLVKWDHSQDFAVPTQDDFQAKSKSSGKSADYVYEVDVSSESPDHYLVDHMLDGRVLFPATGYLVLAWRALAKMKGQFYQQIPVNFENFAIHQATVLSKDAKTSLEIRILQTTGGFEICESGSLVASGVIHSPAEPGLQTPEEWVSENGKDPSQEWKQLTSDDFYKELRLRGYDYGATFRGVLSTNNIGDHGQLLWKDNWITFLDHMLQMYQFGSERSNQVKLPTRIRSICIDPTLHSQRMLKTDDDIHVFDVMVNKWAETCTAGGVAFLGIHTTTAPKRQQNQTSICVEEYHFVPYTETQLSPMQDGSKSKDALCDAVFHSRTLKPCLSVVIENTGTPTLKVVEVSSGNSQIYKSLFQLIKSRAVMLDYTVLGEEMGKEMQEELESLDGQFIKWDLSSPLPNDIQLANLVLAKDLFSKGNNIIATLCKLKSLVEDGGLLLISENTDGQQTHQMTAENNNSHGTPMSKASWEETFSAEGLQIVSQKDDGISRISFLCRKSTLVGTATVLHIDDNVSFEWVDQLKKAMADHIDKPKDATIWLVSKNEPCSGILGLVNCLIKEPGGNRIRCIFNASEDPLPDVTVGSQMFKILRQKNLLMNVYKNGQWGSFRHLSSNQDVQEPYAEVEHAFVNVLTRGDLSSLRWIESPLKYFDPDQNPSRELCSVYYAALNFRDVMLATGKLPPDAIPGFLDSQECLLGMEFSGRDNSGRRIMGMVPAKGMATTVDADKRFLWEVPDTWTLAEAASVPVVYSTVYYALVVRGEIRKGESILIHAGAGGVGQAAISVALHCGCEVYTTVSSEKKKQFLMEQFPQLKDKHFSNSRDTSFEMDILKATKGKGVDLVLNSLSEEKLQASIRTLSNHGRFLEIGKVDLSNDSALGMSVFLKDVAFHGILLDKFFEDESYMDKWQIVADHVTQGIQSGAVRPLKTSVFDKEKVEEAFRFMSQGKHIGKVVIKIREEEPETVTPPRLFKLPAKARSYCDPKLVYIITGGLGGFGLELTQWLIERGGRHFLLVSRSGIRTGYQSRCVRQWRDLGVDVRISTRNIATAKGVQGLIQEAMEKGPVGGVFHLAMVLKDALFTNQTKETFKEVSEPKVLGSVYLDQYTRQMCADTLHWFVVFSSACGSVLGNAGQTNYGFANTAMERLCEKRCWDKLPGLAIQWGPIGDVGVVIDGMLGNNDTVVAGGSPQRIASCLTTLDHLLNHNFPVMSSYIVANKERAKSSNDTEGKKSLFKSVGNILGIKNLESLDPDTTLLDLGLDSLMSVEVRQIMGNHDVVVSLADIPAMTIGRIMKLD